MSMSKIIPELMLSNSLVLRALAGLSGSNNNHKHKGYKKGGTHHL